MTRLAKLSIASCLLIPLIACRSSDDRKAQVEHYTTRGRVMQLGARSIDIQHETLPAIRGFDGKIKPMESMTMPFAVPAPLRPPGLAVGDAVGFTFEVHYESDPTLRVTAMQKLASDVSLQLP